MCYQDKRTSLLREGINCHTKKLYNTGPVTRGQYCKTFYSRNLLLFVISYSVCLCQTSQTYSNIFASREEPTRVKYLSGGRLLALPTASRLGCKGLLGTNTSAYYEYQEITAVKGFVTF